MYNPISTYRIQFNNDFSFRNLLEHLDYFSILGAATIYASPVFAAIPGSTHGYDVVNPKKFNQGIGTKKEFDEIARRLKKLNIGWLQDIVPNHMAVHQKNTWLRDVLENGKNSDYASFFDIDFDHPTNGENNIPFYYRRFFTVDGLISLQMEKDEVFDEYHSFISKLIHENKIQGLRLDHIDGLKDPSKYIEKLRLLAGDKLFIVVEKILTKNESIPLSWPIQGTTGYDFLVSVNNLLTFNKGHKKLFRYYKTINSADPEDFIYQKKKLILTMSMQGDLENLCRMFMNSGLFADDKNNQNILMETLREAIGEFLLAFPRYKLFSDFFPLSGEDQDMVETIVRNAIKRTPKLTRPLVVIKNIFLDHENMGEDKKAEALKLFLRCMQYTGALMAKGIEDTAMYGYNCYLAHNEVGDRVDSPGINKDEFHKIMLNRQRFLPLSLNSTATHDTKRSEDVRARLNLISEMPDRWIENVRQWIKVNNHYKSRIRDKNAPDENEEYFIYQTLAGIYPFNQVIDEELFVRIEDYLKKALREASINTGWQEPDEKYERAVISFMHNILDRNSEFLKTFLPLQKLISQYGIINSLVQITLKTTCPGVPDFYQGTELWDLSMVDPDNRRHVDFKKNKEILDVLIKSSQENPRQLMEELYNNSDNGYIKLWMSHLLLKERELNPGLFVNGKYIPLKVTGKYKVHIMAYARTYKNTWYVVVIPLYMLVLNENDDWPGWEDTSIELPGLAPRAWAAISNNETFYADDHLRVSDVLKMPIPAVLKGANEESKRKAGVLLHITSLPGSYGTGDIGSKAYEFVDFLSKSGQSFWQILPINPVTGGSSYSPYSTYSALAGNILLIDPEWLEKFRLVARASLMQYKFSKSRKTEFAKAEEFRLKLIDEAFSTFTENEMPYLKSKFNNFCEKEKYWIDDFALFLILKKVFKEKSWYKWPKKIRDRESDETELLKKAHHYELEKAKFSQFLFFTQWQELREYSTQNDIRIIGDMAFYVSYESVDVWQNPEVFKLDKNKKMMASGGAPPDYFSETGQFWNMPVYNWENIKNDDFSWWRTRIYRNMLWYDIVRFDHFRGFSGFWEVKATEKTAVNGQWVDAPGEELFLRLEKDFHVMPFIAEDLGDIDNKVYRLRDKFGLPGMKVLQFAFNDTFEKSIHLPHNFTANCIVYTGTHDNNTTRGWFEKELSVYWRKRVEEYINKEVSGETVHEEFIRLAYASIAYIAIIPMQDILGSDNSERFNNPGGSRDSWKWRLESMDRATEKTDYLVRLVKSYWRI